MMLEQEIVLGIGRRQPLRADVSRDRLQALFVFLSNLILKKTNRWKYLTSWPQSRLKMSTAGLHAESFIQRIAENLSILVWQRIFQLSSWLHHAKWRWLFGYPATQKLFNQSNLRRKCAHLTHPWLILWFFEIKLPGLVDNWNETLALWTSLKNSSFWAFWETRHELSIRRNFSR